MKRRAFNNKRDAVEVGIVSALEKAGAKVAELHKQGKIRATGERRKSDNGRSSNVWSIV